jgi:hypothetical protein
MWLAEGVNVPEDKAKQLAAYAQMLDLVRSSADERAILLRGASALLDLDWPSNYIDAPMCQRAVAGSVPRYEGYFSFLDYKKQWWAEDNKKDAERQRC